MRKTLLTAILVTTAATAGHTQDSGDITVGVGVSTFGANLEAAYAIDPSFRVRGALMGGLSADYDETDGEGFTSSGDLDLGGGALLVDYYPTAGSWRLSGGLFFSNTKVAATGQVDLLESEAGPQDVTVTAEFANQVAPMVTAGYEYGFARGWSLNSEIGVVFTGGIDLKVTSTDPENQNAVNEDQDVRDAISDASDLNLYPYLSIGVSYRY